MNRATVVFLALAVLLAHTLAIHQTPQGDFAPPYDRAHAAYRLGRNLVHEGRATWEAQGPWSEAHPSPLLVGVSALAERVSLFPTGVAQGLGILCALATIVIVAQFSPNRMAGLIAPLLLATSGAVAAAAASGTEAPLAMSLLAVSFLAFERGWRRTLLVGLGLLALARPEGAVLVLVFGLLERVDRPRDADGVLRAPVRRVYLPLLIGLAVLALVRQRLTGSWLSPTAAGTLAVQEGEVQTGLAQLFGFLYASGSAPLLILPVGLLAARRLRGTGRRALVLFLAWAAMLALAGGDPLPFWNALAPALPLFFVAIQNAITEILDRRPRVAPLACALLLLAGAASLLVSKLPGDVGPLPLERSLKRWATPSARLERLDPRPMGRRGLLMELREVERLRTVGLFLRDKVSPDASIATFWPGAIGYLSRREVHDLLGRTDPLPGETEPRDWRGVPRVDLVRALEERPDYLVTLLEGRGRSAGEFLREWLDRYDAVGDGEERFRELLDAIRGYELVSVPVPTQSDRPRERSPVPFLLLRNESLGLAPRLEVLPVDERFEVLLQHEGPRQVVDLRVTLELADGSRRYLRPTGEWTAAEVDARTGILAYDTGPRPVRMLRAALPAEVSSGRIVAQLHNPGMPPDSALAAVGAPAVWSR